jgi:peptidoglycan-N-acetylglucosamine deacetylase
VSGSYILTFDIEDWFHLLENDSTKTEDQWSTFEPRIHENTDRILQLLSDTGVRATFFCLGWIAKTHPEVVRRIQSSGHEIGSHSYSHQLVSQQSPIQFQRDLQRSLGVLEDLIGTKVRAYRAPGFSITARNAWAFGALVEAGIEIDSSVFLSRRAHGGFPSFGSAEPCLIAQHGGMLKEFPVTTSKLGAWQVGYSGGGYFRIMPYFELRRMFSKANYSMSYFHPRDFDPDQPRIPGLPWHRTFKSYVGLRTSFVKLQTLLREFQFTDLSAADLGIDWSTRPVLRLEGT